ncbi:tRNA-splicing endonuclease subunit Sen2 [Scaptodrosophila lebanonensis]|uniref:tRNA-intron lyase n=1 Tax=Drosophila lebanonensis TaxID=7225 RepID=A0A6J2U7I0_DROLE|nr:tRNA-splicing endonuclease subunit Sen2 [Scaptodrosophila lebanonensis]
MQFSLKRKPNFHGKFNFEPFPKRDLRFEGIYNGITVEVSDPTQIKALYENGCYGKGSKSRGAPDSGDADEKLLLGLEEAAFLAFYLESLIIKDTTGQQMNWTDYLQVALQLNERFIEHLAAYLYLKSKNWVIKSGIKFGGNFLIYKHSPLYYHAAFLVIIQTLVESELYIPKNLQGLQRVAETSDKDVLLLTVFTSSGLNAFYDMPASLGTLTINETVVRRFNYTAFVQSKQK